MGPHMGLGVKHRFYLGWLLSYFHSWFLTVMSEKLLRMDSD